MRDFPIIASLKPYIAVWNAPKPTLYSVCETSGCGILLILAEIFVAICPENGKGTGLVLQLC